MKSQPLGGERRGILPFTGVIRPVEEDFAMSASVESTMPVSPETTARRSIVSELVPFLLVGGLAAAGYVVLSVVAIGLNTGIPDWIVSAVCYALFIVPVYLAHRQLSFRSDTPHAVALPRYIAVQVSALVLAAIFSFVCFSLLGMQTAVAAALVIVLTSGVNFILLKVWAFAQPGSAGTAMQAFDFKPILNAVHGTAVFNRRVQVLAHHLAEAIPTAGTVLDLGCGDGAVAVALMERRPDLKVEGVDVMLRPTTHIPVTEYDGETLPFADDSFDYVSIVDVLHHTDDPVVVLKEASRVARKGVVIKDHLLEGLLAGPTLRFMDWVGNRGHNVVLPYNYLSRREWQNGFVASRLTVQSNQERLGLYPAPFSWFFDRSLHFVALLAPRPSA